LLNYPAHIKKCKIRHDNISKNRHRNFGLLKSGGPIDDNNNQNEYIKMANKIDNLEVTFNKINAKIYEELESEKQISQSFKIALIDERISSKLAEKQMLNLFAAYKPIEENEIVIDERNILIKEEIEEDIDLNKYFGYGKAEEKTTIPVKKEVVQENTNGIGIMNNEEINIDEIQIDELTVVIVTKQDEITLKVEKIFSKNEINEIASKYAHVNIKEFLDKFKIPLIAIKESEFYHFGTNNFFSNILSFQIYLPFLPLIFKYKYKKLNK